MVSPQPSAATDLRWVLARSLERAGSLFDAEERSIHATLLGLPDDVLGTWARMARRKHTVQRRIDLGDHVSELLHLGVVDDEVDWPTRAARSTVEELRAGARRLGLSARGRREVLVQRLARHTGWSDVQWVRVLHRPLLRRWDRIAFLERRPDPSRPVVERLGHVQWVDYPADSPDQLFPDRASLLAWEAVLDALTAIEDGEPADVVELLRALEHGEARAPGRLDAHGRLGRTLRSIARELERTGDPTQARAIYQQVAASCPRQAVACRIRIAFTLEAEGSPHDALDTLGATRASGPERLAVQRTGRRIAKTCRRSWAPLPPLPPRTERTLDLVGATPSGARPLFGPEAMPVESAVVHHLADQGRLALHAEGGLWRHLFGLLFAPHAFFVPVGQLPGPYLSGPLDLGTPDFAARRPQAVATTLERVGSGGAEALVRCSWERYGGCRLAGVHWTTLDADLALVRALPTPLLLRILRAFLDRGWRAARGLPDLLILPGPSVRLPGAFPSRLPADPMLAEVKTTNDTLSDDQRWWLAHLEPSARVEVWRIRAVAAPDGPP